MGDKSGIEWTDATWNPVTGCTKVSAGCWHCYAEKMATRLQAMGSKRYASGFTVTTHSDALDIPMRWKRARRIFVNSMSDLFHEGVSVEFIRRVFETMRLADWHQYQVLTKRADRLAELAPELPWAPHIWMGVSVENADAVWRIDRLRGIPAHVKFLSGEPLIGPLPHVDLAGIDWVIVGGESGPGARPMHPDWARRLRDQCQEAAVPFFFKQWGRWAPLEYPIIPASDQDVSGWLHTWPDGTQMEARSKRRAGCVLDGRTWDGMPGA